jgi:AcrR family transcriptional regulator
MSILKEQGGSPKARPYRMRRRAELVDATRQRIIEAAVRLHTTVGASQASLSAVAKEAGVTRLTLYRHFATQDELFVACRSHWRAEHPIPDPRPWAAIPDFEDRLRAALEGLYGWYRENGDDLFPLNRDLDAMPEAFRIAVRSSEARLAALLLDGTDDALAANPRLRAAVGHVISFWTWRSLVVTHGLSNADAVDLAVGFVARA